MALTEQPMEVLYSEEEIPDKWRYFESNPEVASQLEQDSPLISDRNQQAAQPEPVPEIDPLMPSQEKGEEDANKVVSGDLSARQELLSQIQQESSATAATTSAGGGSPLIAREGEPLPETEGEAAGVLMLRPEAAPQEETLSPVVVIGPPGAGQGLESAPVEPQEEPQPRRPQPRPQLSPNTLPGPVIASRHGSNRIGAVTASTRFHEFGDYLSRLIETIGYQWHMLVDATFRSTSLTSGTVRVRFTLTREGTVENVRVLQEVDSKQAVLICQDAVQSVSPFSPWTEQMVALLGESQEITINFIYRP